MEELIQKIQNTLEPFLLKPRYREEIKDNPSLHFTHGHCYAASEALFHLLGGMKSSWRPVVARDGKNTHWWLENIETGELADPTAKQYTHIGEEPPYTKGRRTGFLTKKPSKRASYIIRKVI